MALAAPHSMPAQVPFHAVAVRAAGSSREQVNWDAHAQSLGITQGEAVRHQHLRE